MKDALSFQIEHLLKSNKLIIDFDEFSFQIQSHPTYPSLHAVTGVLDHFNIANLALDIPANTETLKQLPNAFLAQVEINEQKEFAVIKKTANDYQLVFNSKHKTVITESEFLEQFTGIILAIDKEESNATHTIKKDNTLSKVFGWLSLFLFGLTFVISASNTTDILFIIFSFIGVYISLNIKKQEEGETSILGNKFCSDISEKKNCNAVLSSKGAIIYRDLKLSDLSIVYFASLTLTTFIFALNNSNLFFVNLLSFTALPVTIYSIYYQARVIKKWCALCLGVVVILWLQATVSAISFYPSYELNSILITVLSFSATIAFWLYQSKLLGTYKSLKETKIAHLKFKRNFELFSSQLNKSKTIDTVIPFTNEIVLGNPDANLHIIAITNPLCGHCKPVHQLIEQILNQHKDSVKITIRFNVNTKNENDKALQITLRLLELYESDFDSCLTAMHNIYGNLSVDDWITRWKPVSNKENYIKTLINENQWCSKNAINFTPELLINGKSFPKIYDRNDLLYFIEELEEQSQTNNQNIEIITAIELQKQSS